jgi:hypothetical protein
MFTFQVLWDFCDTAKLIAQNRTEYATLTDVAPSSLHCMRHLTLDCQHCNLPLIYLLDRIRSSYATGARDKIFCMLSFATDVNVPSYECDISYGADLRTVFIGFVTWYVKVYRNLDFLGRCLKHNNTSTLPH